MRPARSARKRALFLGLVLAGEALLLALGAWQLRRLEWKRDLIARVEQRAHAPAVEAPDGSRFDAGRDEYRAVSVRGRFLNDRETLVQAVTRLGSGYWVLTPLATDRGFTVLVNRGFVEASRRPSRDWGRREGDTTVAGLLRLSEPGGGFLRDNQPSADRWYSRDVAQIAATHGLQGVAPYFIDAAAEPTDAQGPAGGLTVLRFNDNHLQYALTWFALALLLAGGAIGVFLRERGLGKLSAS